MFVRQLMLIPIRYSYISWEPPKLTDEEELAMGREIAAQGREHFVAEFRKSIGRRKGQPERQPAAPLKIFGAILFFVVGISFIVAVGMGPFLVFGIVVITGIYLLSMHFATRKFERWIDHLVAKYAAYVAKGGQ